MQVPEGYKYIELFGVPLQEPFTVLTDILIAIVCFYAWRQMVKLKNKESFFVYMKYFFLLMGFATIVGGILGHGYMYMFGKPAKIPGWYISMFAIAAIERAAIIHVRPLLKKSLGHVLSWMNIAELVVLMGLAFYYVEFIFVEIHAVYGLLFLVASLEMIIFIKNKNSGSKNILIGVLLSMIAAIIHAFKINLNDWFNYNDIAHLWMAGSVWYIYKGVTKSTLYDQKTESIITAD